MDISKFSECIEKIRSATNSFKGCPNTPSVRAQLEAACTEATNLGIHMDVRVVRASNHMLTVSFVVPPDTALALCEAGVMCPICHELDMHQVEDTDIKAINQGYHPRTTRKCGRCGEYTMVSGMVKLGACKPRPVVQGLELVDAFRVIDEVVSGNLKPLLKPEDIKRMLNECKTREAMETFAWEHSVAVMR